MPLEPIKIALPGGDTLPIPRMIPVEQRFPSDAVGDVKAALAATLAALPKRPDVAGKRIAITAGSRGIPDGVALYRALIDQLKAWGAQPFVFPAMGSHGGGTAEGQIETVRSYGLTEEALGVPILSSMEVVESSKLGDIPLYCDKNAHGADGIVVVNKIKPHTSYKGDYESGLCKMMIIGMGKHHGATVFHSLGFARFAEMMPKAAAEQLKVLPVVFGLGLVENAYDGLAVIEAIAPERIVAREKELLITAKDVMGKLLMSAIDVLVVDEVGKNISGTGMDPTVTGRAASKLPGFVAPPITRVALLDITEESHGNATGFGVADMMTLRMFNKIDLGATYTNTITSRNTDATRIPMILNDDKQAITVAVQTCLGLDPAKARIVRIANTKKLHKIWMSEPYRDEIEANPDRFAVLGEAKPFAFDNTGALIG
jgi:hypothetical protein